jgi:uncharacterized protein (DUF1684 family)
VTEGDEGPALPGRPLALLDWRRRVAALYGEVRATADPAAAHARWRAGRDDLLRQHPESPVPSAARAAYPGADVAPYDPAFRFTVALEPAPPERLDVATGTDGVVSFARLGRLALPGIGTLDAWWLLQYGGGLFVPLRDATAGSLTYGGGRYLLDTAKGADLGTASGSGDATGGLVVDLNFAYQPSCAYDPAWACPLAPPGNVVRTAVPVGERYRELGAGSGPGEG